jgi:integrase
MPVKEYLTKDEIKRLFDAVDSKRDKLLFRMGLAFGPRVSEISDIPLRNIVSDRIKIHDIKKKCYRDVILDSGTRELLDRYLQTGWSERHRKGHWSKRNRKGQRADKHERLFYMSPKTINRVVKFWFERAEIPLDKAHWHVFRHTYIYQSMEAGVPISHLVAQTGDSVEVLINDYGMPTIDSRIEVMEERGRYWEPGVKG